MDANENIVARLKQWMEDEGMSSPTGYGANTPEYIYKMWGGEVPLAAASQAETGKATLYSAADGTWRGYVCRIIRLK